MYENVSEEAKRIHDEFCFIEKLLTNAEKYKHCYLFSTSSVCSAIIPIAVFECILAFIEAYLLVLDVRNYVAAQKKRASLSFFGISLIIAVLYVIKMFIALPSPNVYSLIGNIALVLWVVAANMLMSECNVVLKSCHFKMITIIIQPLRYITSSVFAASVFICLLNAMYSDFTVQNWENIYYSILVSSLSAVNFVLVFALTSTFFYNSSFHSVMTVYYRWSMVIVTNINVIGGLVFLISLLYVIGIWEDESFLTILFQRNQEMFYLISFILRRVLLYIITILQVFSLTVVVVQLQKMELDLESEVSTINDSLI